MINEIHEHILFLKTIKGAPADTSGDFVLQDIAEPHPHGEEGQSRPADTDKQRGVNGP